MIAQPISFAYRNLVFGGDVRDAWALYRVQATSYDGLGPGDKRDLLGALAGFAYSAEADFQLLRVTRQWAIDDYLHGARALLDPRHGHRAGWEDYLAGHRAALGTRPATRPEVYLAVRLAPPDPPVGRQLAKAGSQGFSALLEAAKRALTARDARGLSRRQLGLLQADEHKTFATATDYLDVDRATTGDIQWLVRRALCRGLGEPELENGWAPQALVIEDEDDEVRYVPLERDLLRLMDAPIELGARDLCVHSEAGESHQAMLCLGALPEAVPFPGRQAELLFAPLEALGFPVDASFTARYVANEQAVSLVRRRIVDADNTYVEESHGDHGPSSASAYRPQAARELEEYLTAGARPPLLRAQVSLAVAASSRAELEERVERVRREYAPVKLHRPLGDQLPLFCGHLPGQHTRVAAYDDYLTVEQLGAMVPTACHAVGSQTGPYIGYTLSGSRQPVLFDLTEASRTSRPPSILMAGTLGSGKTIALQLLLYQAFLQGSVIVDVDPKGAGDHRLADLPGVAGHVESIELSSDRSYAGMLDPLRIAPLEVREDLAVSWLIGVLPQPIPPGWRREVIAAVRVVAEHAVQSGRAATCGEVVGRLLAGEDSDGREVGRTLEVYADTGLARLGFSSPDSQSPAAASKQVTMLGIRNLARPLPGTPHTDYTEDERIGQSVLRLLAAYAMRLVAADPSRHAVLGFDEAWVLLSDSTGRRLIEVLNRMGRSLNVTPILASQTIAETEELDNLLGARFVFGMESEREARRGIELLGLDPDTRELCDQLMRFRAGRCLIRDYQGRVARCQVDLVDPGLLARLDTTPHRDDDIREEPADGAPRAASA